MPIYEYTCEKCQTKFDKLVRAMSAADESSDKIECPKCGSLKTARALSVFAVGSEQTRSASAPGCGRCGGPGPCAMG